MNATEQPQAQQHRIRWYVYTGGPNNERIPRQASMRGRWPAGYDVTCSCGWESRTGGAVQSYVRQLVWEHKHGFSWAS